MDMPQAVTAVSGCDSLLLRLSSHLGLHALARVDAAHRLAGHAGHQGGALELLGPVTGRGGAGGVGLQARVRRAAGMRKAAAAGTDKGGEGGKPLGRSLRFWRGQRSGGVGLQAEGQVVGVLDWTRGK